VLHLPAQDVLEIETAAGRRLVPFVAALVPDVDLEAGRLTVVDIAGLLDDRDADED
jgi:16S rRNA processing protein RimM